MKNCPHCGGEIQDAAIKCKHCREMLGKVSILPVLESCFDAKAVCRPPGISWKMLRLPIAIIAILGLIGFVFSQIVDSSASGSSPITGHHPSTQKSSGIDPRLIHPQSDELVSAIQAGKAPIPIGYHIERDGEPGSKLVLVRKPTDDEKAEHALSVEKLEAVGVIKSLTTSLRGGPEPEVLVEILGEWVKSKASIKLYSKNEMEGMVVTKNTIKRAKISNEYTRTIDGETVFFYDFQLEVLVLGGAGSTEVSCSFVKRGKAWYLYSANGRRMENF